MWYFTWGWCVCKHCVTLSAKRLDRVLLWLRQTRDFISILSNDKRWSQIEKNLDMFEQCSKNEAGEVIFKKRSRGLCFSSCDVFDLEITSMASWHVLTVNSVSLWYESGHVLTVNSVSLRAIVVPLTPWRCGLHRRRYSWDCPCWRRCGETHSTRISAHRVA